MFRRRAHVIELREALIASGVWIGIGLLFDVFVYFAYEHHWFGLDIPGQEHFRIPALYQHRVLFWGIIGAVAMRAMMIVAGVVLIERFHWTLYVFGVFLIVSGLRMATRRSAQDPEWNPVIRLVRRLVPVTPTLAGEGLVVRVDGRLALTPLALALVMIESSDAVLAVDSIPAVFAITDDPFLVFTSNVMALLGLRSLYFAVAGIIHRFYYLRVSLALLLVLIGTKMLLQDVLQTGPAMTYWTLAATTIILAGGVIASIVRARRAPESYRVSVPARRGLRVRPT